MKRLRIIFVTILAVLFFMPQGVVRADVNNFTVTNFTADYYLSQTDPHGSLDVTEQISVNFTDDNHGIERALPQRYNGQDLHLTVKKVLQDQTPQQYTTSTSNGNSVLRIGDPGQTITGQHRYVIDYSVRNVITFPKSTDSQRPADNQLVWNTNGTQWGQPFDAITARLHIPSGLVSTTTNLVCYTGAQGSGQHDCTETQQAGDITFTTTRRLEIGENMTFAATFPLGTFTQPTALDWWKEHAAAIIQIVVPPVLAFVVAYSYWRKNGKDLQGRGTIVPMYGPPDDIRAAEADVIINYKMGTNALSATIIDLAIRGYLKIVEGISDGVLGIGKHTAYSFERLPAPAEDTLKPYEATVLAGIFPEGTTTNVSDLKNKFYIVAQLVQKNVPQSLTDEGYFSGNPKKVGSKLSIIGAVLFAGGWLLFGADWALAVGIIVSAGISLLFASLMARRTQKGQDAKDDLAGLKLYMNVAEKDRLAMLQSVKRPYASPSDAPQQTVALFEKLLPFAMIMGVEKSWAKQFESIYTSPPDWYGGNWAAFNAVYLVGSLNQSVNSMNSSFAAPSSAGSGSGGGFSGGGGGGGGGGGW